MNNDRLETSHWEEALPEKPEAAKYYVQMNVRMKKTVKKALRGEPTSQCELGDFYAEPDTPHTDFPEALKYYQEAARSGHYRAFFEMCKLYDAPDKIPDSKEKSILIYTEMAVQGFPSAQYILGMKYWLGDGVENDVDTALEWLRSAAEQNHEDAIRNLADIYSALQNETMAQLWYKTGAKLGDAYCKEKLES